VWDFPTLCQERRYLFLLVIFLYTRAKCSHVVSIRKREDPGNEKAVCLSPFRQKTTTILPLSFCFILVKCSWLVWRGFRLGVETLQHPLATNISQVFDNCLLLLNLIRERMVGNPSATKGQTDNIKNLRIWLWSTLDVMLNEFAYELRLKVFEDSLGSDETPHQPRTFYKYFTIVSFCVSFCFFPQQYHDQVSFHLILS